jgi:predicted aspartyl protease
MTVYTFDYSTEYDPPGPIVEFQVSKAGQQTPDVTLSALVDSGADATMLPITALQSIGARYVETRQMRGIVGLAYPVDLYLVSIRIGVHPMPAVRVIAGVAESEAIIGRDVLNHLVVTLNGLASVTEIGA